MDEQFVHKNRLQDYAQRASIPLPSYQNVNEGSQHAPQFRSTVLIDGATFVSPCTFGNRRAAEQYVAKFALERITSTIKLEGIPLIHNDTTFCKCILQEYADKMKLDKPAYSTTLSKGLLPLFITTVNFDGKTYEGRAGKNKKEAEQIAARTVIEWILGNSSESIIMSEIIKSKARLYDAINGCRVTSLKEIGSHKNQESNESCLVQTENHSADTFVTENHMQIVPTKDVLSAAIWPIQVNGEPCDSPIVLSDSRSVKATTSGKCGLNDSRSVKATTSGKHSRNKDDKGSPLKKARSTEYLL